MCRCPQISDARDIVRPMWFMQRRDADTSSLPALGDQEEEHLVDLPSALLAITNKIVAIVFRCLDLLALRN